MSITCLSCIPYIGCLWLNKRPKSGQKWGMRAVKNNSISNIFSAASVAAMAALLSACASTPDPVLGVASATPRADLGQEGFTFRAKQTYELRPSDEISVNVFREPDFSLKEVQVGVDGFISMPMLGAVQVGGMSTRQVEAMLTQKLDTLGLKNPRVAVNISEYASHLVTVEGAVETPGVYRFQPGARLSSAVALARGPRREAKSDQLAVFRVQPDGIYVAKFDYGAIKQGTMLDPVLEPNDRVVMGTNGLSLFYQDFVRALPAFGVFSNAAIRATE